MSVNRGRTLLSLLIPASLTEETADPRIKTYKVGQVARAASIFRVDEIVVYKTPKRDDSRFISTVLRYAETPQYLRKEIFPMQGALRHIGVIPPLRIPSHTVKEEEEYREGIVTKVGTDGNAWVDVGSDSPAMLPDAKVEKGQRVTVRIYSRRPLTVELVKRSDVPLYWGYEVRIADTLHDALETDGLRIATSRLGHPLACEMLSEIKSKIRDKVSVAFGSPSKGLEQLLHDEGHKLEDHSDCVVNSIPNQGTATVRAEEAIYVTLGLLNLIRQ
ncbi:putative RNA uridine N3 methyltransferase [Methanocella conradii]|uniref:putative RNA uridine N3 methyltransferase n=1 Tax=Methanocella conradii TaxID=1175444 RepID=UPI0024B38112|nr:putative RNA uridine N3 methyltransferase [Methanocella conradii]MDI6896108.1 putative RNA uridine N3 methyltransferase [Methanocella conradii]